jgi:prepilin-type N-terminal cleavage/methylation domain-containing protein
MKKYTKGFTLIELLVVIAIIGILSSVVLASLNTARNKGTDAAIKSQLAAMRAQAEVYYDTNNSYYGTVTGGQASGGATIAACQTAGSVLNTTNGIGNMIKAVSDSYSSTYTAGNTLCAFGSNASGMDSWAVSAKIKGTDGTWCVDSSGASVGAKTALGGAGAVAKCQ